MPESCVYEPAVDSDFVAVPSVWVDGRTLPKKLGLLSGWNGRKETACPDLSEQSKADCRR